MTLHYFYILPLHNVHIVQYLATEQAYLQSPFCVTSFNIY